MARPGGRSDRLSLPRLRVFAAFGCISALLLGAAIGGSGLASTSQAKVPKHTATSSQPVLGPAAATAAFGLDLMRAQPPGNLVLSPDSIAAALAMTGTGAAGHTATEISGALHLEGPDAFGAVGNLQHTIAATQAAVGSGHPDAPTLNLANGLFLQQGLPVKPPFLSGLQQDFGVAPEVLDFEGDPFGSLDAINAWVNLQTNGVIPELFTAPLEATQLVLANAVCFKGDWRYPFDREDTSPAPFYKTSGRTSAEFMHRTGELRYGAGRGYAAVELPYRASTLSLLVVLPSKDNFGAFQRRLGARGLARIVRALSPQPVALSLPRFHMNTNTALDSTLKRLGMPSAFSESADFSRITGDDSLKIGTVVHAADLRVDEAGTVAAAATGVVVVAKSRPKPVQAVPFNANRPFLFFLRDRRTGAVLFAGRLTDPDSAGI